MYLIYSQTVCNIRYLYQRCCNNLFIFKPTWILFSDWWIHSNKSVIKTCYNTQSISNPNCKALFNSNYCPISSYIAGPVLISYHNVNCEKDFLEVHLENTLPYACTRSIFWVSATSLPAILMLEPRKDLQYQKTYNRWWRLKSVNYYNCCKIVYFKLQYIWHVKWTDI